MREESHLDDMRRAIRGDFERLAERLGGQELMQGPVQEGEEPAEQEQRAEIDQAEAREEPAAQEQSEPVPSADTEPPVAESEPPPEEETSEGEPPRRGFFARLLGL